MVRNRLVLLLNLKHEQNRNSQQTGNFNRIQEYVYDDKDVQSQLSKIVDAKKLSNPKYEVFIDIASKFRFNLKAIF